MIRIPLLTCLILLNACVPTVKYERLELQYKIEATENEKLKAQLLRKEKLAKARMDSYQQLLKELKPLIDRKLLQVEVVNGQSSINMTADVLFSAGSSELSSDGRTTVVQIAKVLSRRTDRDFQVQGHTDSDPIRTDKFESNWHLGAARAINVVQAMMKAGMPNHQPGQISAATFGPARPVGKNDTEAGKSSNRRIEIVLLPDLTILPGYDELMEKHGRRRPRNRKPTAKPPKKP